MKKQKSFTLIELLVIIAIIGLLASVVAVSLRSTREKARVTAGLEFSANVFHGLGANAVGVWDFDEGKGDTAYDRSGYGNDGTFYGDITSWQEDTPSGQGWSLYFDGVDDYVDCGKDESLNITDKITIESWIYPTGWGEYDNYGYGRIIDKAEIMFYLHKTEVPFYTDYSLVFNLNINAAIHPSNTPADSISLNTWQHVVATYDGSDVEMYINGQNQIVTQYFGGPSGNIDDHSTDILLIGESPTEDRAFQGYIDQVRIYNQALPTAKIQKHYVDGLEKHQNLVIAK